MNFPVEMKTNCFTWLMKMKSPSKLQRTQFIRKFGILKNSNKLIFVQDGAVYKCEKLCQIMSKFHVPIIYIFR